MSRTQFAAYSVEADRAPDFTPAVSTAPAFAVQAGTYPDLGAAEQAARRLTGTGAPLIRLLRQDGKVVYSVVIPANDQAAAAALQRQVAARGFALAEVVRP